MRDSGKNRLRGKQHQGLLALLVPFFTLFAPQPGHTQITVDGTTASQVSGNNITAGTVAGSNLYHSFRQFNVPSDGVTFGVGNAAIAGGDISNILVRVTGGSPSSVLGAIQSRQAFPSASLYLLNPSGIVFGTNARLDIGGSFHATTATSVGFGGDRVFGVTDNSTFPSGNPSELRFGVAIPAAIINQGNLSVALGQNITLSGGTAIATGTLSAPNGTVGVLAVPGNSKVELRSPEAVLGLSVAANSVASDWSGKITELPRLAGQLTGSAPEVGQVVVNADGSLAVTTGNAGLATIVTSGRAQTVGSFAIAAGDVAVKAVTSGNAQLQASNNLALMTPQISTTGNLSLLSANTIVLRDTIEFAANIFAGGNLTLRGDRGIDILALNHPNGKIESRGKLSLLSNGLIYGDAYFFSQGNFTTSTLSGGQTTFIRLYQPVFNSGSTLAPQ